MPEAPDRWTAALLSVFSEGLVICDRQGNILHHNARAQHLLTQSPSQEGEVVVGRETPQPAPEASTLTDRSIFEFVDRHLLVHAMDEQIRCTTRDEAARPVYFAANARPDLLLRVEVSPVEEEGATRAFILVLRVLKPWEEVGGTRGQLLQRLTEGIRRPLASMRAAIETMVEYPDMDEAVASQFKQIILDQSIAMSDHLNETLARYTAFSKARWPLEVMSGDTLLTTLQANVQRELSLTVHVQKPEAPLRVRAESYSLVQGVLSLMGLIANATRCEVFTLRMHPTEHFIALDVVWSGSSISLGRLRSWGSQPLDFEGTVITMTLKEVIARHEAEVWSQTEEDRAYVRFLLPSDRSS